MLVTRIILLKSNVRNAIMYVLQECKANLELLHGYGVFYSHRLLVWVSDAYAYNLVEIRFIIVQDVEI